MLGDNSMPWPSPFGFCPMICSGAPGTPDMPLIAATAGTPNDCTNAPWVLLNAAPGYQPSDPAAFMEYTGWPDIKCGSLLGGSGDCSTP